MAVIDKPSSRWWTRLHVVVRFLGLTGLMACGFGLVWAKVDNVLSWEKLWPAIEGETTEIPSWIVYVLLGGSAAALLALLVEIVAVALRTAGRRSAFGFNVGLQAIIALALLVGVNVYSQQHYLRLDWTRPDQNGNRKFTLPEEIAGQLSRLQGETTVVVYQRHKTFGALSEKPDRYDYAAERKVAEKVHDLAALLREFGPQFRVIVLDVEEEGFDKKLAALTENAPELRQAIDQAPENSIFFHARDRQGKSNVQRLSFNAFYQLDKTASRADNRGRGNLVLRHQGRGVPAFARRALNIDARRPRVAVLTVHELLSTKGSGRFFVLKGLGKSLAQHGFEVVDIILKKDLAEPVVYTYDESKFDTLGDLLPLFKQELKNNEELLKNISRFRERVESGDNDALAKALASEEVDRQLGMNRLVFAEQVYRVMASRLKKTNASELKKLRAQAVEYLGKKKEELDEEGKQLRRERDSTLQEREALAAEEGVRELQRMTDRTELTEKLNRLLADCDLVIVPRYTIHAVNPPEAIPHADIYPLHPVQAASLKKFLADGKPILACLGPINEEQFVPERLARALFQQGMTPDALEKMRDKPQELEKMLASLAMMLPPEEQDRLRYRWGLKDEELEKLLGELGIQLGKHTVLYRAENKRFASSPQNFVSRTNVEVPPVKFEWAAEASPSLIVGQKPPAAKAANPIRESMRIASRSVGADLDLQVRYGRPVYYQPDRSLGPWGVVLGFPASQIPPRGETPFEPEIMLSDKKTWNEDRPFLAPPYRPEPPKEDGPRGTLESKGNGPFPLGVAVQAEAPESWYEAPPAAPVKVRVAAIGDGGLFAGDELSPAKERLLVDTCNWLLGRDDLLARENPAEADRGYWKFPRLTSMTDRQQQLWFWGAQVGMPLLFGYLGIGVWMMRRLR